MRRQLLLVAVCLLAGAAIALAVVFKLESRPPPPDGPSVVSRIREVARLETLEVSLYKKLHFAPDPLPTGSLWGDVLSWMRYKVSSPQARAIVFAKAHLGLDLERLGPDRLQTVGRRAFVVLPPLRVQVELQPGETEIIGSTLDSVETARLFELAREAFEREVEADEKLRSRARSSAERAIRELLTNLGFVEVHFVESLPMAG
ncbi:MAG TPA: DUF4230 domain-containing protein [Myxococcales bacterium]|nr:DUF4230 domain-containing protein [Myxococcales bacterium]